MPRSTRSSDSACRITDDRLVAEDPAGGLGTLTQKSDERADLGVTEPLECGHDPAGTTKAHGLAKIIIRDMGQFARDYRAMFGELPSETLKRSA